MSESYTLGKHTFTSRLIVGTGKYKNLDEAQAAIEASGAEMVTLALRRIDTAPEGRAILDVLSPGRY